MVIQKNKLTREQRLEAEHLYPCTECGLAILRNYDHSAGRNRETGAWLCSFCYDAHLMEDT